MARSFLSHDGSNHAHHDSFPAIPENNRVCEVKPGAKGSGAVWVGKNKQIKKYVLGHEDGKAKWLKPDGPGEICRWNVGDFANSGEANWGGAVFAVAATFNIIGGNSASGNSVAWRPYEDISNPHPAGIRAWWVLIGASPLTGSLEGLAAGDVIRIATSGGKSITGPIEIIHNVIRVTNAQAMLAAFGPADITEGTLTIERLVAANDGDDPKFCHHATPESGTFPTNPENNTYRLALEGNGTPSDRDITGTYEQDGTGCFRLGTVAEMVEVFGNDPITEGEGDFVLYSSVPEQLTATFSGTQPINVQRGSTVNLGVVTASGGRPPYAITTGTAHASISGSGKFSRTLTYSPPSDAGIGAINIRVDVRDTAAGVQPQQIVAVDVAVNIVEAGALNLEVTETLPENFACGEVTQIATAVATGGEGAPTFTATATHGTATVTNDRGNATLSLSIPCGGETPAESIVTLTVVDSGVGEAQQSAMRNVTVPLSDVFNVASNFIDPLNVPVGETTDIGTVTVSGGALPITLSSSGSNLTFGAGEREFTVSAATGTTTAGSSYTETITATDANNLTKTLDVTVNVKEALTLTTTIPDPVDAARSSAVVLGTLTAAGGNFGTYTFSSEDARISFTDLTPANSASKNVVFTSTVANTEISVPPDTLSIALKVVDDNEAVGNLSININVTEQGELAVEFESSREMGKTFGVINNGNDERSKMLGVMTVTGGTAPYTPTASNNLSFAQVDGTTDKWEVTYSATDGQTASITEAVNVDIIVTDSTTPEMGSVTHTIENLVFVVEQFRIVTGWNQDSPISITRRLGLTSTVIGTAAGAENLGTIRITGGSSSIYPKAIFRGWRTLSSDRSNPIGILFTDSNNTVVIASTVGLIFVAAASVVAGLAAGGSSAVQLLGLIPGVTGVAQGYATIQIFSAGGLLISANVGGTLLLGGTAVGTGLTLNQLRGYQADDYTIYSLDTNDTTINLYAVGVESQELGWDWSGAATLQGSYEELTSEETPVLTDEPQRATCLLRVNMINTSPFIVFDAAQSTPINVAIGSTVVIGTVTVHNPPSAYSVGSSTPGTTISGTGLTRTISFTAGANSSAGLVSPVIRLVDTGIGGAGTVSTATATNAVNITTS